VTERAHAPADAAHARRFQRQILLLGARGQAAIDGAEARVDGVGAAHAIAVTYARAAGFRAVTPGAIDVAELAPEALAIHEGPRELLAASRAVLREIGRAMSAGEKA
jgi:hypothetical protein